MLSKAREPGSSFGCQVLCLDVLSGSEQSSVCQSSSVMLFPHCPLGVFSQEWRMEATVMTVN